MIIKWWFMTFLFFNSICSFRKFTICFLQENLYLLLGRLGRYPRDEKRARSSRLFIRRFSEMSLSIIDEHIDKYLAEEYGYIAKEIEPLKKWTTIRTKMVVHIDISYYRHESEHIIAEIWKLFADILVGVESIETVDGKDYQDTYCIVFADLKEKRHCCSISGTQLLSDINFEPIILLLCLSLAATLTDLARNWSLS